MAFARVKRMQHAASLLANATANQMLTVDVVIDAKMGSGHSMPQIHKAARRAPVIYKARTIMKVAIRKQANVHAND